MKSRVQYFLIICLVIILGLLSRKLDFIPLFAGDILYAVMIYFMVRFLLLKTDSKIIAILSIIICYAIEFLQLCQASWLVEIRNTTFGHLIFGQGFLWSDLVAYTFGVIFSFTIEKITKKQTKQEI